jgi:hypothetical protein
MNSDVLRAEKKINSACKNMQNAFGKKNREREREIQKFIPI